MRLPNANVGRRAVFVTALLLAAPSEGSIFDTYGFGSRGAAMGNALTALALDYHAVYYNPAQLMERPFVHVGAGVTLVEPWLSIDRDLAADPELSRLPGTNLGFHIGISTPLGGFFEDRVAFGFGMWLPLLRITRAQFDDYSLPQFYMYENLPDKLLIAAAVAGKPFDWWKVGVGLQILADLHGQADVQLSLVDQRVERRKLSIDLTGDVALTAGTTFTPASGLNLAVSYRQELDLTFSLPIYALIEEVGLLYFDTRGTSLYTPHQLSFGASWALPWASLTMAADVTFALWSLAPSPAPEVELFIDDSELNPGEPEPARFIQASSPPVALGARDIVIPRVGLEYELGPFELRAGYFYRPTPIPMQAYETNYVDSDAHCVTIGAAWTFADPTRVHKRPLTVGLALQLLVLRSRRYDKVDPTDATGGYTAGGVIMSLGLDLQHDF